MTRYFAAFSFAAALLVSPWADAAEKGYLGLGVAVDGEGFFLNPTVKKLTVDKVAPASPAAKAGIESGDQIIEIEGHKVAGKTASDLKAFMDREPGQTLRLVVRKPAGAESPLSVVLGRKPD